MDVRHLAERVVAALVTQGDAADNTGVPAGAVRTVFEVLTAHGHRDKVADVGGWSG